MDRRTGDPTTTHPDDLVTHLEVEHHLGMSVLQEHMPREVLELAHAQRHAGYGVGADHAATDHAGGGFK